MKSSTAGEQFSRRKGLLGMQDQDYGGKNVYRGCSNCKKVLDADDPDVSGHHFPKL